MCWLYCERPFVLGGIITRYHPVMLNRAALEVIRTGTKAYGVTKCCKAFDLSQDSGIGTFAWMYRLTHIYMPEIEINYHHSGYSVLSPALMAVHAVRHDAKTGGT